MTAMTLTAWWKTLLKEMDRFLQKFPPSELDETAHLDKIKQFAKLGLTIESRSNSLIQLKNINDEICQLEQTLPHSLTHPTSGEQFFVPQVCSPFSTLFAVLYYNHLCRFEHIESSVGLIQNGVPLLGKPGVQQNKPIVANIAQQYKTAIEGYLADNQGDMFANFPDLADLPASTPFDKCQQLLVADKSLEEKLADRFSSDFEESLQETQQANQSPLFFLNQLNKRLAKRQHALAQVARCKRTREMMLNWPKTDLSLHDYLDKHSSLMNQFFDLYESPTNRVFKQRYLSPPAPKNNESSLTAVPKTLLASTWQLSKDYLLIPALQLVQQAIVPETFKTQPIHNFEDKKKYHRILHLINVKVEQFGYRLSTKDTKITRQDFEPYSAKQISKLSNQARLLRTITDTDQALHDLLKNYRTGIVQLSNWSVFGIISRLFNKNGFLARLLNDTLRLTYEIEKVRNELSNIKAVAETTQSATASCQTAFKRAMVDLKFRSQHIEQSSLYAFFKDENRQNCRETAELAESAYTMVTAAG